MIFRIMLFSLVALLVVSCAKEVTTDDGSECLAIIGDSGPGLNNSGYIIDIRSQNDVISIRDEYISNYGSSFDVTEISGRRIFANINSNTALDELRCDDPRIEKISYDSIPENQGNF